MLVRGRYNKEAISGFARWQQLLRNQVPPWRKVIEFDRLPDTLVEEAVSSMEQQFVSRTVTQVGEMLHIFALRMMMAKHGMLTRTVEEVTEESKSYVNDLLKEERLPISDEEGFDAPYSNVRFAWRWFLDRR